MADAIKEATAQLPPPKQIRWYGWKPDTPDVRDRRMAAPGLLGGITQPAQGFLNPQLLPPIRNQGPQGSCTGHSTRSAMQYLRNKEGQTPLELSPRFIYYCARLMEGTVSQDAGAEIRDCIRQVNRLGVAAEALCKYNPADYKRRPSVMAWVEAKTDLAVDYARPDQSLPALKQAILDGFGFVFGFTVYQNFESPKVADFGLMDMPSGDVEGGHAVWCCGYDDGRSAFLVANSWDTDWGCKHPLVPDGKRGYFWMPYAYMTNKDLCDDFWVIRKVS